MESNNFKCTDLYHIFFFFKFNTFYWRSTSNFTILKDKPYENDNKLDSNLNHEVLDKFRNECAEKVLYIVAYFSSSTLH